MNDTTPEIEEKVREMMMARSGAERLVRLSHVRRRARDHHRLFAQGFAGRRIQTRIV